MVPVMASRSEKGSRLLKAGPILLAAGACFAQQVVTFRSSADGSQQPYALRLPRNFDAARQYPLVISLHMEETDHLLNLRQLIPPRSSDIEFIAVSPSARGGIAFRGIAEKDVYDTLADVQRRYRIDEDRIYLTGISMGGGGALWLALTRPDLWAAAAPLCPQMPDAIGPLAGNALDLPIQLFHGESDPIVPVSSSRKWQKRFLELGVPAEYTEYPGLRHNAWEGAYRHGAVFEWFSKFKRDRFPERVRFTTSAYKYASAYWVHLNRLTPGTAAAIDARFTGTNRVTVSTQGLEGFSLNLAGHPRFSEAAPLEVEVDGTRLRPRGRGSVSFLRTDRGWISGSAPLPAGFKRPGLEGPISDAVLSPHIYVYGTADAPGEEEVRRRREMAETAARWSTLAHFPVKSDRAVTDQDLEDANLVLFGNKETNTLIARLARHFPVELNSSAADYGLIFVVPAGSHYVVVNSGLPWWTGADQMKRGAARAAVAPWRVLDSFGDYMLFKGTLGQVVAEGRFDRNWKLPSAAAERMARTGAVTIPSCCQTNFANTATR